MPDKGTILLSFIGVSCLLFAYIANGIEKRKIKHEIEDREYKYYASDRH